MWDWCDPEKKVDSSTIDQRGRVKSGGSPLDVPLEPEGTGEEDFGSVNPLGQRR